jgi:hypothetical protein
MACVWTDLAAMLQELGQYWLAGDGYVCGLWEHRLRHVCCHSPAHMHVLGHLSSPIVNLVEALVPAIGNPRPDACIMYFHTAFKWPLRPGLLGVGVAPSSRLACYDRVESFAPVVSGGVAHLYGI